MVASFAAVTATGLVVGGGGGKNSGIVAVVSAAAQQRGAGDAVASLKKQRQIKQALPTSRYRGYEATGWLQMPQTRGKGYGTGTAVVSAVPPGQRRRPPVRHVEPAEVVPAMAAVRAAVDGSSSTAWLAAGVGAALEALAAHGDKVRASERGRVGKRHRPPPPPPPTSKSLTH